MDETLIAQLRSFPEELRTLADTFPASMSSRRPATAGAFSLVEHIYHFVDFEAVTQDRIETIRRYDAATLVDFDGAQAALDGAYVRLDLHAGIDLFSLRRNDTLRLVSTLTELEWLCNAEQEGVGVVTTRDLVQNLRTHDRAHFGRMLQLASEVVPHP